MSTINFQDKEWTVIDWRVDVPPPEFMYTTFSTDTMYARGYAPTPTLTLQCTLAPEPLDYKALYTTAQATLTELRARLERVYAALAEEDDEDHDGCNCAGCLDDESIQG